MGGLTSLVSIVRAVHQLLLTQGRQGPGGDLPGALQGARGGEGPTWSGVDTPWHLKGNPRGLSRRMSKDCGLRTCRRAQNNNAASNFISVIYSNI